MSRTGNPYDNALAESFMRTLKCEEVYLHSYRDRDDALLHIQDFLERIYKPRALAFRARLPDTGSIRKHRSS
ncbi:MAG: integrase core domain-containing protein [Acidobacteriota bacterium]|nr:integrase core domain-containing protein [Acidobacteriota bacterium]